MNSFHPLDAILRKRNGLELSAAEIQAFVRAVAEHGRLPHAAGSATITAAGISDAQIAAFLMAVFSQGLSAAELGELTQAMRFSGEVLDASSLGAYTVDKHSTGGVGDKTSLLIAPIVAAAGLQSPLPGGVPSVVVPMISGRSLGHTGGTLDKLETIPGFTTQLGLARMLELLKTEAVALGGQTPDLVPADRVLYALRDHTGTVESPFLITASIMSKKLAEDLRGLVLDVKVGSGAFMPTYAASKHLAELMVETGERAGTRTVALLTSMNEPLGRFSGNWVEVWECVDILQGRRHPMSADLIELSNILAGWMLFLAGKAASAEAGAALADRLLRDGSAYRAWLGIVQAQGGDVSPFEDPEGFHAPRAARVLRAGHDGYLAAMDCRVVGTAVQRLGAGRSAPGEPVSAHAGIESHAKLGQYLHAGDPIFTLFSENEALIEEPFRLLASTVELRAENCPAEPLIREVVQSRPSQF